MPDIMGEYVDRLVTVEMRNRAMNPGITLPLYLAAREEGGGRPLTARAAEGLIEHVHRGDNVIIITGAGTPPTLVNGESDGPPGAAAIAHALYYGIGATPIYVCEQHHAGPIVASSEAVGVPVRDFAVTQEKRWASAIFTAPLEEGEVPGWAAELLDKVKPAAVVSTERLGPNEKGVIHGATGLAGWKPMVDLSPVLLEATKRGAFSVGVGDAGNEMGFGRIHAAVKKINPYGERCQCPCGAGNATVIPADVLVPAFISNWGCYGIEAMMAFLLRKPEAQETPAVAGKSIAACIEAGGLEAMGCTKLFYVDGAEGETSMAIVQILRDMVRVNLQTPDTGPCH